MTSPSPKARSRSCHLPPTSLSLLHPSSACVCQAKEPQCLTRSRYCYPGCNKPTQPDHLPAVLLFRIGDKRRLGEVEPEEGYVGTTDGGSRWTEDLKHSHLLLTVSLTPAAPSCITVGCIADDRSNVTECHMELDGTERAAVSYTQCIGFAIVAVGSIDH